LDGQFKVGEGKRYEALIRLLENAIQDYALETGHGSVAIVTSDFTVKKYPRLNFEMVYRIYSQLPAQNGYSLARLPQAVEVEEVFTDLVWYKKLDKKLRRYSYHLPKILAV
jgi:hypothetical protein